MFSNSTRHNKWIWIVSLVCVVGFYLLFSHAASVDNEFLPTNSHNDANELQCTASPCFTCQNISIILDETAKIKPLGAGFYKQATAIDFENVPLVVKIPHSTAGLCIYFVCVVFL